jgi:hypothetical protein
LGQSNLREHTGIWPPRGHRLTANASETTPSRRVS